MCEQRHHYTTVKQQSSPFFSFLFFQCVFHSLKKWTLISFDYYFDTLFFRWDIKLITKWLTKHLVKWKPRGLHRASGHLIWKLCVSLFFLIPSVCVCVMASDHDVFKSDFQYCTKDSQKQVWTLFTIDWHGRWIQLSECFCFFYFLMADQIFWRLIFLQKFNLFIWNEFFHFLVVEGEKIKDGRWKKDWWLSSLLLRGGLAPSLSLSHFTRTHTHRHTHTPKTCFLSLQLLCTHFPSGFDFRLETQIVPFSSLERKTSKILCLSLLPSLNILLEN